MEESEINLLLEEVKERLGPNYREDDNALKNIIEDISSIASEISNRLQDDTKLYPIIKKAATSEYLARGAEGKTSVTEGSQSSSFEDIIERMKKSIISSGLRRLK